VSRRVHTLLVDVTSLQGNVRGIPQRNDKRQPNWTECNVRYRLFSQSKTLISPHVNRIQERNDFEALDLVRASLVLSCILTPPQKNGYRAGLVEALKQKFPNYDLTYSIGGQISFDVFPNGWDKTFALKHVEDERFEEIHFFGDKTYKVSSLYI